MQHCLGIDFRLNQSSENSQYLSQETAIRFVNEVFYICFCETIKLMHHELFMESTKPMDQMILKHQVNHGMFEDLIQQLQFLDYWSPL